MSRLTDIGAYSIDFSLLQNDSKNGDTFTKQMAMVTNTSSFLDASLVNTPHKRNSIVGDHVYQRRQLANKANGMKLKSPSLPPKSPISSQRIVPILGVIQEGHQSTSNITQKRRSLQPPISSGASPSQSIPLHPPPPAPRFQVMKAAQDSKQGSAGPPSSSAGAKNIMATTNNALNFSHLTINDDFTTSSVKTTKDDKGKKVINQYIVLRTLASGSYGKVKCCLVKEDQNKRTVAMKVIKKAKLKKMKLSKNKTAFQNVQMEIAVMKKLNHPHLVKLIQVMDDPQCQKLYIIMELMEGGTVQDLLDTYGTLQMYKCQSYFRQLIIGLQYCHECANIIHRDIKPSNLLLDKNKQKLKLADFGVSKILENSKQQLSATVGSNYFMAPQVTRGGKFKGKPSDVWACGVTLYKMVTGKYPFVANHIPDLYNKIQNDKLVLPQSLNKNLKDLLVQMLQKDPTKRIKISQIKDHDWITSNGVNLLPKLKESKVEVNEMDLLKAISTVTIMNKIRIRIRQHLDNARKSILKREQTPLSRKQNQNDQLMQQQ